MSYLGYKATDRITGFAGIITGRCEYISGCTQLLIVPPVGKDGAHRDGQWYDEQRVVIDRKSKPVVLDNGMTPGPDKAAPIR